MSQPRPDFVLIGGQSADQVYLMASKSLTEIELRSEVDDIDTLRDRRESRMYGRVLTPPTYRHFVTAEMKDWVQVIADDYPTAFATLFEQWTPASSERRAIADPARQITGGPREIGGAL